MKKTSKIVTGIILCCIFASPALAQSILKGEKIPKDLVITLSLSSTTKFADAYDYKITSDGRVFFENHSRLLPAPKLSALLITNRNESKTVENKPKEIKLRDNLSKNRIKQIILEFERSGFFSMNDYYEGDPTSPGAGCVNHADTKGLSISAHGKTKKVAFFLGCSYGEKSPLKNFLSLFDKISEELKGVKKRSVKAQ